jgi:hypothetical protein
MACARSERRENTESRHIMSAAIRTFGQFFEGNENINTCADWTKIMIKFHPKIKETAKLMKYV